MESNIISAGPNFKFRSPFVLMRREEFIPKEMVKFFSITIKRLATLSQPEKVRTVFSFGNVSPESFISLDLTIFVIFPLQDISTK